MNSPIIPFRKIFEQYKALADKTFDQLNTEQLFWQPNESSNSIAMIIQHMSGNMLSRWTDFLHTDGEKPWRQREQEFDVVSATRDELLQLWQNGWDCLFNALDPLTATDLERTVYIRNEAHTVMQAITRQIAHYPYHIGQIVFIGKFLLVEHFIPLSIPRGGTEKFNAEKFKKVP